MILSAMLNLPVSSFSVEPARENVDDGHNCKFFFKAGVWVHSVVENDESCPNLTENPFDDVDDESGQAVSVGHHNFFDQASLDVFQKPLEAFSSFEVET